MTIWILAVLVLASTVGMGLRQGGIRAAISFIGIVVGALVAVPLGHLVRSGLVAAGVKNATLAWFLGPVIAFLVVLILFKVAGQAVHKKVEVFYKYKAGELRLALWDRLIHRLGICIGFLNGTAYLALLSFAIYIASYWTVQLGSPEADPRSLRLLNQLGRDLESTGMEKVARAIDHMPAGYYESADLVGVIYRTPLIQARLSRYPAFLSLSERPEFQDLGSDTQFSESWLKQKPVMELVDSPKVQAILKNPDLLKTVWAAAAPNLEDLGAFLTNGISQKYSSEKILGRWDFDVNGAMALVRKAKPTITAKEAAQWKRFLNTAFSQVQLVATPERQAIFKNVPQFRPAPAGTPPAQPQTLQGQWMAENDGKYQVTVSVDGKTEQSPVEIEGSRLTLTLNGTGLAFLHED